MNLQKIQQQYQGLRLTSLVQLHMKTLNLAILPQAIRGTLIEFDEDLRPLLDNYTDEYILNWCTAELIDTDLSLLFADTIADIRRMLNKHGRQLTDKRIFDVFHIMALKLALKAYNEGETLAMLGLDN